MFAYCGGNPVYYSDPAGNKCIFGRDSIDYGGGVVAYTDSGSEAANHSNTNNTVIATPSAVPTCVSSTTPHNASDSPQGAMTAVSGITLRVAFGLSLSISGYIALDTKGNMVFYISPAVGGGFPSASAGWSCGAISAPDANALSGLGATIGGSLSTGLKGGGDYIIAVNPEEHTSYHGLTSNVGGGIAVPVPVEIHGEMSYSFPIVRTNMSDIISFIIDVYRIFGE